MSPPLSRTKLLTVLPHLCKLSMAFILLLFFIPSLFFSLVFFLFFFVFLFFPLNPTFFLPRSSALSTGRVLLTSVIRRTFWRSCGWTAGQLSDSDTEKVDDDGEPPECIALRKSEFPSFDASSNSSSEEEVEQEQQLSCSSYQEETKEAHEHEEQRLKDEMLAPAVDKNEEMIINDAMSWDAYDLDALVGSEDVSSDSAVLEKERERTGLKVVDEYV